MHVFGALVGGAVVAYLLARAFLPGLFHKQNYSGGDAPRSDDGGGGNPM